MRRVLQSTALTVALVTSSHLAIASPKALAQKMTLNIDEPTLTDALLRFTEQSHLQMVFSTESAAQLPAPKLVGTYTAEGALDILLKGSGLEYHFVNDRTVTIRQAQQPAPTQPASPAPASRDANERYIVQLDEIVVTGSWIRGGTNTGSQMITLDRDYIAQSGYATVHDIIRTLPQDFPGNASEDDNVANAFNANRGVGVNLRGLGVDSTLVLVNGRRPANGGLSGGFTDIYSIQPAAIERIEVLTDGASAIYGSDAVGGVVNFILRKDFSGAESHVRAGTLSGDSTEYQASQLLGTNWADGNAMLSYEYYRRDPLDRTARTLSASDDLRQFGGSDFRRFNSNPGTILSNTNQPVYAIPAGQDGTALTPGDFVQNTVNYQTSTDLAYLLPAQELHNAFFTVSQDVGRRFTLSAEGRFATRDMRDRQFGVPAVFAVPATNPFYVNPFGTDPAPVRVAYDFVDDLGPISTRSTTDTYDGALRALFKTAAGWQASLTGSHNAEKTEHFSDNLINGGAVIAALQDTDPTTALNLFGDGSNTNPATLASIRASQLQRADATATEGNLTVDGPLFLMPAGPLKLAVGANSRRETLEISSSITGGASTHADVDRTINSAFAEFAVPLVSAAQEVPAVRDLQISLAARYDDYSDSGNSVDPRYGVSWKPVDALTIRGTLGKSFKAPRLIDQIDSREASVGNQASIVPVPDPQSPTGTSRLLRILGGNPDLKPETATTWTAGFDLAPLSWSDFSLSLTYFDIDYRDRIAAAGPSSVVLVQEDVFAQVITRNPTAQQIADICNGPLFVGDCTNPPDVIADLRLVNLSRVKLNGVDLLASKTQQIGLGELQLGLNAAYTFRYDRAFTSTSPVQNIVDTFGNPLKLRMRGEIGWSWKGLAANSVVNYSGAYEDTLVATGRRVPSLTTIDLQLSYETDTGHGWLDGSRVELSAVNLFDKDPAFFNVQSRGYDSANNDLYGRILSVELSKSW